MDAAEIEKLASLEHNHWWYAARRAALSRALRTVHPGKALDVGAGAGGQTQLLEAAGWQTTAVELSPTGAAIAGSRGLRVLRADATSLPFADEAFDLVVAMDIWEHINDDGKAASETFRVLKPGGHAYIAVPCDMRLWSGHDTAVGHVRRYGRAELVDLVERTGFQLEEIASWNVLLRPVAHWRRRRPTEESDLTSVPHWLNTALRLTVGAERFLPVKKLPGVSLVVRARKPSVLV